ncbi:LxmA leader domain family RiPP [Acrocarpospora sp. B8E8]|uniref:LxmA leader domain family RiPP n=1 Tax=Acrocarpospora sp. B8E8 TaxID=3153572 RepID=UPI00325F15F7
MPVELLMEGADNYTSLAEVAVAAEMESPEATPALIISFSIGVSVTATAAMGC